MTPVVGFSLPEIDVVWGQPARGERAQSAARVSMSHLSACDRALVLILVPVWAICFALGVKTVFDGGGLPYVGVSLASADAYPALTGEVGVGALSDPLEAAGLRSGDLLVRVGGTDLRGIDTYRFGALARQQAGRALTVPLTFERDGRRLETSLALSPLAIFWPHLATSLTFAGAAVFLLLRAAPTPTVRACIQAGFCFAIVTCPFAFQPWFYLRVGIFVVAGTFLFPLLFRLYFLFPDDRPPESRWHRVWPWAFVVLGPFLAIGVLGRSVTGVPMRVGDVGAFGTCALGLVALLIIITQKYRHSDSVARRQIKWLLFGLYCAVFPVLVGSALLAWDARLAPAYFWSFWAVPLLPVIGLIPIVRFNLFDIDRLLSTTASYNIVLGLLVATLLIAAPRVAEATSKLAGVDPGSAQIALSLLLAAVAVPAQRRLRPRIERYFFPERHAVDQGLDEVLEELASCSHAQELTDLLGRGLERVLQPKGIVVYRRDASVYAPVFVAGRTRPAAVDAASPLIAAMRQCRGPLALERGGRRQRLPALSPFERAALETVAAAVLIPIRRGDAVVAFVALMQKRSGDVYTATDLALLSVLAERAAIQLARIDEEKNVGVTALAESVRIVVFTDMVGNTQMLERLGDAAAQRLLRTHNMIVRDAALEHGGTEVKQTGDGFLLTFSSAISAINCARQVQESLRAYRQSHPDEPIEVRIGMNAGEPISDGGDVYGASVNAAARICAKASSGEILVSDVVRQLLTGSDVRLVHRGRLVLKGFRGRHSLYAVDGA